MSKNWSNLQLDVFKEVIDGVRRRVALKAERGMAMAYLVRARAGTGKTTTAVETIIRLRQAFPSLRILFTVFANRNRADMEKKLQAAGIGAIVSKKGWGGKTRTAFQSHGDGTVDVMTLNSLGLKALSSSWGRVQTVTGHTIDREIADRFLPPCGKEEGMMSIKDRKGIEKLVMGAMAFLAHDDASLGTVLANTDLNIEWDFDKWPAGSIFPCVRSILDAYLRQTPRISFAHQIYVPAREKIRFGNYDVVIVDESQDQSPAKMVVCEQALRPDGVMMAVGDPAQAIFGFAGADGRSTQNYIDKWRPKVLPLSITYRCPKVVVESVKHIVPDYQAHETAPDGEIIDSNIEQMYSVWKAGDVCISATNAPTVKHCLAAWRQGRKAMVLGRDFADELKKLLTRSGAHSVTEFLGWLAEHVVTETERLLAMKRTEQIEKLNDIEETMIELCSGLQSLDQVKARMDEVFAEDPKEGCILLTSTHKFKGGEAAVVFMFCDTYKPTGRDYDADEQVAPADCLWYVARTRVMAIKGDPNSGKLYLVPVKEKKARAGSTIETEAGNIAPAVKDELQAAAKVQDAVVAAPTAPAPKPATVKRSPAAAPVMAPIPVVTAAARRKTVRQPVSETEAAEMMKWFTGG